MYFSQSDGLCEVGKGDLSHLEAAGQLRAEGQTGALTGRQADAGGQQVQDREDGRRDNRDGDDLLDVRDLLRDDRHRDGDGETLQEILDSAGDELGAREIHRIFGVANFFTRFFAGCPKADPR